jgi:hypothetical protein
VIIQKTELVALRKQKSELYFNKTLSDFKVLKK